MLQVSLPSIASHAPTVSVVGDRTRQTLFDLFQHLTRTRALDDLSVFQLGVRAVVSLYLATAGSPSHRNRQRGSAIRRGLLFALHQIVGSCGVNKQDTCNAIALGNWILRNREILSIHWFMWSWGSLLPGRLK
jgi:hypothetical protein